MSRPASYTDHYVDQDTLPLFNQPPPPVPASHPYSPYSPSARGPPPIATNRPASQHSNLPYVQHPQEQRARDNSDLMPSATDYLARSTSLGRKKDPFTYRSDDVESGFGSMDIMDGQGQQGFTFPTQREAVASPRSGAYAQMNPPPVPAHIITGRQAAQPDHPSPTATTHAQQPVTPSSYTHPHNPYIPSRSSDPGPSAGAVSTAPPPVDPYHPSAAGGAQWTDYRRPSQTRMASTSSFASHGSGGLSPYLTAKDVHEQSPLHSPLLNPYDTASPTSQSHWSTSPAIHAPPQIHQPPQAPSSPRYNAGSRPQASPVGGRPPPVGSRPISTTHTPSLNPPTQLYPSSQPVTPAGKYDPSMPPPKILPPRTASGASSFSTGTGTTGSGMMSRSASAGAGSEGGFREVKGWSDLRAVVHSQPNGRRADPDCPGKWLSPLKCLTTGLAETYTLSNPNFRYVTSDNPRRVLTKPSKPAHNDGADNEDWDYILYVNDVLGGEDGRDRYIILDVLGQGTFGQVVKCQNMKTHEICAVKVVKNKPAYLQQSKMEVAILELLNTQHDPQDQHHILRMQDSFTHKHHLCLVFECLSSNLYELIKQNQFKGLSTQLVKVFTQQLLDCMAVLKEARLIHCDLKPENILLKSLQSPQIKVIDFGSACHEMQTVYTYIQSRFYRSPEVLLGLPYSTSIDMWSLGCIVVELFLGLPLFPGTSEYNQVSRIVDMLGNPPTHLLEVGKQTHEFFNRTTDGYGRNVYKLKPMQQYAVEHRTDEQPSKQYFKQTKLKDIIMEYPMGKKTDVNKEIATRKSFVDFAEGLLNMDPIKRWSPQQAMKHPFITGEKWTGPWQPDATTTAKKPAPSPEIPQPPSSSSSTPNKKYGGLVQTPQSSRSQRVYSDAAAYNHQLAQHQSYTASVQQQQQAAQEAASRGPFSPGYQLSPGQPVSAGYGHQRVASQQLPPAHQQPQMQPGHQSRQSQSGQWSMPPPQGYQQQRMPSLSGSASHASLRAAQQQPPPPPSIVSNPPPNSYYPSSRTRANTINQMDAIPPALARLVHFGAQDPNGRNTLTPVMNRDEAIREWERRHQGGMGHNKQNSIAGPAYQQLEYLQEQAELAAMQGQNWVPYPPHSGHHQPPQGHHPQHAGGHHRQNPSGQYQMQPHIGISPPNPSDYRPRPTSDYDPPLSAHSSAGGSGSNRNSATAQGYGLPTYPPVAATTSGPSAGGTGQSFDAFDQRDGGMGMMYTPLQPTQVFGYQQSGQPGPGQGQGPGHGGGHGGGHVARSSYSGGYGSGNPFGQPNSPRY
ncbi:hypothetical protein L202_02026 [Cryptococcus amylolentus CBS 6039]|uniref:Protein kinase domain-containing protein n=2 Tax=Cryptococcus amylolentus TaxID=104669 RepID=A0A1E3HZ57_9TREE|nr:hypothetical protein L202_02026 [Cryptococcus amylolentus CBS 6039]ODN81620.1 hypothetical protein L202_02026 [Cryptococcus amylolentus CBS 6039]ODO10163.1 hypothetical protein I350_02392 [Cryptococcus amylolentus CBS 6273]